MDWGDWSDVASVYQAVVVTIVGLWAYFRFRKERTHHPHIDFSVDCNIFGEPGDNQYVAEFLVILKNHGYVQQRFEKIILRVRIPDPRKKKLATFKEYDRTRKLGESSYERLYLPEKLVKDVDIVPSNYKPYIVEPGCEEEIRYITPIPANVKYMLAHVKYFYPEHIQPDSKNLLFVVYILKMGKYYAQSLFNKVFPPGYPTRPRTTETFIQVEPEHIIQRSTENITVGQSHDVH